MRYMRKVRIEKSVFLRYLFLEGYDEANWRNLVEQKKKRKRQDVKMKAYNGRG